jgi:tripartite-type tricarboxylate transporter receptor subunit TctC
VTTPKRTLGAPDIPTIAESGLPGYEMKPWIALFRPAGLDKALVDTLNATVSKALREPAVVKTMVAQGLEPWIGTPAELGQRMVDDRDRLGKLIAQIGVRND